MLPETRVTGLHVRRWQCGSIFIQIFVVGSGNTYFETKMSAKWPFKVIQGHWFQYQTKARMQLPTGHQQ